MKSNTVQSMSNKAPTKLKVARLIAMSKALTKEEIIGDRGVEDFLKWTRNFAMQDTGHFVDFSGWDTFLDALRGYFKEHKYVDVARADEFIIWIKKFSDSTPGVFTSEGACEDFAFQVDRYILNDGFIGDKSAVA